MEEDSRLLRAVESAEYVPTELQIQNYLLAFRETQEKKKVIAWKESELQMDEPRRRNIL